MGMEPTGVDATIFAFVAGTLCPVFDTPIRTAAERHDNLKRYVEPDGRALLSGAAARSRAARRRRERAKKNPGTRPGATAQKLVDGAIGRREIVMTP